MVPYMDLIVSSNIFYDIDNLDKQLQAVIELCRLGLLVITASIPSTQDDTNTS
ncbi:unnamed protein product, partial [Rotaria sp. Silwood1]